MKKIVAITLALLVLAGCSSETYTSGLGMVNSIGSSKSATEEAAGLAQADVTAASVMLDSKGTIVGISFDVVQTKVNFDATGTITTDLATEFKTKKELKEDYNMKPASPIGKEWYEQIDALEIMGVNSASYLILPKIVAAMLFFPFLTILSILIGILGGWIIAAVTGIMIPADYVDGLLMDFKPYSITYTLIKTVVFAYIITSISAFYGYNARGNSMEVGAASTRAVVASCVVILLFDLILTQVLLI